MVKSLSASAGDVGSWSGRLPHAVNEAGESQLLSLGSRAGGLQPLSLCLTVTEARAP